MGNFAHTRIQNRDLTRNEQPAAYSRDKRRLTLPMHRVEHKQSQPGEIQGLPRRVPGPRSVKQDALARTLDVLLPSE